MKTVIRKNDWLVGSLHGWGNGYVLIDKDHKLHGVEYVNIDVDIHGGLTYSELVTEDDIEVFGLTKDDVGKWLVGFDTCHYGDSLDKWPKKRVQKEAELLLKQLLTYEITTPQI